MAPPQRPNKNEKKKGPICCIFHYKKKFPGIMPSDPPNSLICPVFLTLAPLAPSNANVWSRLTTGRSSAVCLLALTVVLVKIKVSTVSWFQGCRKWGGEGGSRPPCPLTGGARGGGGCPSTKKTRHHKHTYKLKFKKNQKRK